MIFDIYIKMRSTNNKSNEATVETDTVDTVAPAVFTFAVNRAAIIDRVDLSIQGRRHSFDGECFRIVKKKPILSPGGFYATAADGVMESGNPFQLKYGRVSRFPQVPRYRLTVHSQVEPLSCTAVQNLVDELLPKARWVVPTRVEVAFDTSVLRNPWAIGRQVKTTTKNWDRLQKRGRRTYYLGSPKSRWQLCIYDRCENHVRLEWRLYRSQLRLLGISSLSDIALLAEVDPTRWWSLVQPDEAAIEQAVERTRLAFWRKQILLQRPPVLSEGERIKWLSGFGIDPSPLFSPAPGQNLLLRMLRNLVW